MTFTLASELSADAAQAAYDFQLAVPSGNFNQWPYWTRLNPPNEHHTYLHFRQEDVSGATVSSGLVRLTRIGMGLCFAAVQRGPATRSIDDLPSILPQLEAGLRKRGAVNLTVNPYWLGEDCDRVCSVLTSIGYRQVPVSMQNMPTMTALIDLEPSEDQIMANFRQKTRTAIRKGAKLGLTIEPVETLAQAKELTGVMSRMAADRGMTIDNQFDFVNHYHFLQDHSDAGVMLRSVHDAVTLGGVVAYREGRRAGFHAMASDPAAPRNLPRNHGILWDLMRIMREFGCIEFDLIGYPDDRYETPEAAKRRGAFKAGFNPMTYRVPPLMTKPLRPIANAFASRLRVTIRAVRQRSLLGTTAP